MARDNTGKKQETNQLDTNNKQIASDISGRNTALGSETSDIDKLEAQPGLGPDFLNKSIARNADIMDASYGGAEDTLHRDAATTGHLADDVGLYPQTQQIAAMKARDENATNMNYQLQDATAALDTRRQLPGMRAGVATTYAGSASGLSGQNASLISGRMSRDAQPTFGQQWLLAGTQAAGQAANAMEKAGCWIAEAIYGETDPRTHLLRAWLNTEFVKSWFGRRVMGFYLRYGKMIAAKVKTNSSLKSIIRPLFELALRKARA